MLGERSSQDIDKMLRDLAHLKILIIVQGAIIYLFAATLAWFFLEKPEFGLFIFSNKSFSVPLILLAAIVAIGLVYWLSSKFLRLQSLRRDLDFEHKILQRVVSLIHEQMRRVSDQLELSPVAIATYEIRIIRLDRSKRPRSQTIFGLIGSIIN